MKTSIKIKKEVVTALNELKKREEFHGMSHSDIVLKMATYHATSKNEETQAYTELKQVAEKMRERGIVLSGELQAAHLEIERLTQEKQNVIDVDPKLEGDKLKAKALHYAAEQAKEGRVAQADATVKAAEIKGATAIVCKAMTAAAQEGNFKETFGPQVKDLIPSIFTKPKNQIPGV